ncbi:flagellar hook-basal body complex protein FliE [Xinfangfangia sp. D13-10-4-6]|uniref:flagellar hook-basal body complex protein FliE n=1 Tax=Pseudogemmobacter hezensis TaxID=2737662 RepID=UPI0015536537|nr:flagellar hook-basal body complex protein FliE [Pseudogemmobacter hezensis]NPD16955.1 flagellar hook-basal body complex protein FliE [Pseudogemmobacter hezensis]
MDLNTSFAAANYAQARTAAAPGAGSGLNFSSVVGEFTDTLMRHEITSRQAMAGEASPHALVEALSSSQLAVETVATVRDKVVEAYQEILRMPV